MRVRTLIFGVGMSALPALITILANQPKLYLVNDSNTFFSTQGFSHAHIPFRVYEFLLAVPVLVGLDYGNLEVACRGTVFHW